MDRAVPTAVMTRLIISARPTTPPWAISRYAFRVSPCGQITRPPAMLIDAWVEKLVSATEYSGNATSSRITVIVPDFAPCVASDGRSCQTGRFRLRRRRRVAGGFLAAGAFFGVGAFRVVVAIRVRHFT